MVDAADQAGVRTAFLCVVLAVFLASGATAAQAAKPKPKPPAARVTQAVPPAPVVVAVIDTGIASDHPAFSGRVLPGWNFVSNESDASDDNGHGTAVAGIIDATERSLGGAGACGRCRLLPVKVLNASGTGDWNTIATGITWAVDHGAQVINLSVGLPHVLPVVGGAISYALSRGAIVIAAAGNDGTNEAFYPAAYPGVISVAGVDANAAPYAWSNYGPWVTVAAPGCVPTTTWPGGAYTHDFCGTSAAAPFVAALAAISLSLHPQLAPSAFTAALNASSDQRPDTGTTAAGEVDPARLLTTLAIPAVGNTRGAAWADGVCSGDAAAAC